MQCDMSAVDHPPPLKPGHYDTFLEYDAPIGAIQIPRLRSQSTSLTVRVATLEIALQ